MGGIPPANEDARLQPPAAVQHPSTAAPAALGMQADAPTCNPAHPLLRYCLAPTHMLTLNAACRNG
eukprot:522905-Rhodomonas_salina.1